MSNQISCPKCDSTQLSANKKGFSGKKAVAGAVLTGGVGLLAGTIGSNKIVITCLGCGHQWQPGPIKQKSTAKQAHSRKDVIAAVVLLAFIILTIVALVMRSWLIFGIAVVCLWLRVRAVSRANKRKYGEMKERQ